MLFGGARSGDLHGGTKNCRVNLVAKTIFCRFFNGGVPQGCIVGPMLFIFSFCTRKFLVFHLIFKYIFTTSYTGIVKNME